MKTERELQIEAYIEKCPDAKLPNKEPVFIHGKFHELEVFRLPIKLLVSFSSKVMASSQLARAIVL